MTTQRFFTVPTPIDWTLLVQQKQWLLSHAEHSEEAVGLIHLLDAIQDAAVDLQGIAEGKVFPNLAIPKEGEEP